MGAAASVENQKITGDGSDADAAFIDTNETQLSAVSAGLSRQKQQCAIGHCVGVPGVTLAFAQHGIDIDRRPKVRRRTNAAHTCSDAHPVTKLSRFVKRKETRCVTLDVLTGHYAITEARVLRTP